jgi:molecular chaperone GrpE
MSPKDVPTPVHTGDDPTDPDARRRDDATEGEAEILDASEGAPEPVATPASDPDAALAALRDRWLRTEADLQNYRRRAQRDVEEARRGAEDRALLDLIAYLDDLERALKSAHESGAEPAWVQGVDLVAQRMRDALVRAGVTAVMPLGEPFDPRFHEALIQMPAPVGTAPGTVLHVERTGYRRGDSLLRAARVAVAADPAGNA